jgi:hypothetical protein
MHDIKYWNPGNDIAIFRVGDVPEPGISLQNGQVE